MPTQTEEQQAAEFLKRAEIRTMKKDLAALRESDALKERDKIVKIKTLEEQQAEQEKKLKAKEEAQAKAEKIQRTEILQKNERQQISAEEELKKYALEQERQQIFLLESQRLDLEKQSDAIDKEKDPALKLEKNKLLLQRRDLESKLNAVLEQEKKLEQEQKFIADKAKASDMPAEQKGLEQRRWDLDKDIQDIEKKRWAAEKEIQENDNRILQLDKSSEQLVIEKNGLRDKILGIDKSLREIFSGVINREKEKRKGTAKEQLLKREALSEMEGKQNEKVQREQWRNTAPKNQPYLDKMPQSAKEKILNSAKTEEAQREQFMQDVENWSEGKEQPSQAAMPQGQPETSSVPTAPKRMANPLIPPRKQKI